jgi:aminocarboxymuconate-semialdehyde decarboxylase
MRSEFACGCGISRRRLLQGGLAAAATAGTMSNWALAQSSPTGPPAAIDIHAHYFPQGYLDVLGTDGARFGGEASRTATTFSYKAPAGGQANLPLKFINLPERLAEMDQQGVAVQALSLTSPMAYWADAETNHKLAKAWNDGAIAAHKSHPGRFLALATLPMLDPDRAIDELNRVGQQPGVRGVYLGTNINGKDLDDPLFQPVFARIEALDLPVFLHPLQTIGGARLGAYYLNNFIGNPLDTGIAASRLIFGGVLDRHPRLQVNLPHAGGVLPILIGRIDHGWRVRKETKHLAQAPSTYLRRFTYDTIAHSKPIMEFVISQVGADRIMLGSDYCYDMGYTQPVQFVDQLNLSPDDRRMILGGTAARLLKLAA